MNQLTATTLDASTRLALAALRRHLVDQGDYSSKAVYAIICHVADGGNLDDAPFVYDADVAALTEVLIAGFEPVETDDPAWDADEGLWTPSDATLRLDVDDLIESGYQAALVDLELAPETDDRACPCGATENDPCRCETLLPIAGGSLDADQADFEAWLTSLDATPPAHDQVEAMRQWYDRHPLSEINADRTD